MQRLRLRIACLVLICCTPLFAGDDPKSAFDRLLKVDVFSLGGIGYAPRPSQGEKDFRLLMAQPKATALQAFQKLFNEGSPQAKGYALVAIRSLSPAQFKELLSSMSNSSASAKVVTQTGCVQKVQELRAVAKDINEGQYDYYLTHPLPN